MNVLYFSDCFVEASVFSSQVDSLCQAHAKNNNLTLLALSCKNQPSTMDNLVDYRLVTLPVKPWTPVSLMSFFVYLIRNRSWLASFDVVHCRGHVASFLMIVARLILRSPFPLIADIRGALVSEVCGRASGIRSSMAHYVSKFVELMVFLKSDYFFFVSDNMRKYYYECYPWLKDNTSIFPTVVNEDLFFESMELRSEMRAQLNIPDSAIVYIYSGGVSYWQNIASILCAFYEKTVKCDLFHLIVLVTDQEPVNKLIDELGLVSNRIHVRSCEYSRVNDYLNASDVGLIIRDNSIVNHVASPTKVREYYRVGLTIHETLDGIGDVDFRKWGAKNVDYMALKDVVDRQHSIYRSLC